MALGKDITIFEPKIWFSPNKGTQVLPKRSLPYGADWPSGWFKIHYTANGAQWTFVNPKQDIATDEVGILKTIAAGTHTINVTLQSRTPFMELIQKIAALRKVERVARSEIIEIKFATGATANGNVGITLPGLAIVNTAVTSGDTAAGVATKVAASTFTGWTVVVKTGATDTVVFTKTATGEVSGSATVTPNATGVTVTTGYPMVAVDGYGAHEQYYQDPSEDNAFLIGMDGHFGANSLRETAGRVRIIGYNVEQTDNPQIHFRTLGADSLLQPTMTARALTSVIDSAQVAGTGMQVTDLDPDGRLDFWIF